MKLTKAHLRQIIKEELLKEEVSMEVIIKQLAKEHKKLSKNLYLNFPISDMIKVILVWNEGTESDIDVRPIDDSFYDVRKRFLSSIHNSKEKKNFDKEIKDFCKLCDKYADKFGIDKDEFFDMVSSEI